MIEEDDYLLDSSFDLGIGKQETKIKRQQLSPIFIFTQFEMLLEDSKPRVGLIAVTTINGFLISIHGLE